MNRFVTLAAVASITGLASAGVLWDEGVDGDLSNDELAAPTAVGALSVGSNTVTGTTAPSVGDDFDAWVFDVTAGTTLQSIILTSYAPDAGGNTSGYVMWDGANGGTGIFLGGSGFGAPDAGSDIIGTYGGPLGAGTYTFSVREFGGPDAEWSLDFVVVPAPGAAVLAGIAGLAAVRRRR